MQDEVDIFLIFFLSLLDFVLVDNNILNIILPIYVDAPKRKRVYLHHPS